MNLGDTLISSGDIEAGLAAPDGKPFTRLTWGTTLAEMLRVLPQRVASGHEREAISRPPGVFGPACLKHYTIFSESSTYQDSVTVDGKAYTVLEVMRNWLAGQKPDVVVSREVPQARCPGDDE